ncbi:uncharacterized protein LOC107861079 isoform X2 [Capsicum annuum]|uniref:uncharacterized protein LOC107861079 isoform X2 n=1 Tax=Capsicum annuum TaxID=4072 RepID=UPI0007BEEC3B|nr:uncharacterized protein LOC107861079 isoform X2 [Capsicum annuum]
MSINDIKAAWIAYNVQSFCILSLLFQVLLLLLAPFRKKTGSKILMVLVWSAYMAADWAPAFILNLIINYSKTRHDKAELMSFWASCMLLHLGGSDHAIAFSLEDNDLWFRYAFTFIFMFLSSAYVFYLSFSQVNFLWIPNVLVFLAGVIKCYERARARFIGSMDKSITLSNPRYDDVVKRKSLEEPHNFRAGEPDDVEVIKLAYAIFRAYKGVLVKHKFTFEEYGIIQRLLQNRTDLFAFRIAQAELEILHDVLYTKAQIFHENFGNKARSVYWVLLAAALASFSLLMRNNKQFDPFDLGVTYSLLIGVPNKKRIEETNYQVKELLHGKKKLGQREACQEIMTEAAERRIPEESFLYEAFKVVNCLQSEPPWCQDRVKCWETIHKTWIAILFDAAKCSEPRAHAQYLVRGGEILSLIWLLGANCGSMAQFQFFEDSDEENQTSHMARFDSMY